MLAGDVAILDLAYYLDEILRLREGEKGLEDRVGDTLPPVCRGDDACDRGSAVLVALEVEESHRLLALREQKGEAIRRCRELEQPTQPCAPAKPALGLSIIEPPLDSWQVFGA